MQLIHILINKRGANGAEFLFWFFPFVVLMMAFVCAVTLW